MSYVELMLDQGEITPIDWAGKKMVFDIFKADDHIILWPYFIETFLTDICILTGSPGSG